MVDIERTDFFTGGELVVDPYPYYEALRDRCPVTREPHHDVVMVSGYDEALGVYRDGERFSSCTAVTGPFPGFPLPLEGDDISDMIERYRDGLPYSDQLPTFDPPKHTQHRGLLMRLLTPRRLKENEDSMWGLADGLLDECLGGESCEFVGEFAGPFAMLVIADLLGVPEEDHDLFRRRTGQVKGGFGSTSGETLAHAPLESLYEAFTTHVQDRREHLAFGHGVHFCPGAPLARPEGRITLERLLDRTAEIRISEEHHGPPGDRRYRYHPTYILRGLQRLHIDVTAA